VYLIGKITVDTGTFNNKLIYFVENLIEKPKQWVEHHSFRRDSKFSSLNFNRKYGEVREKRRRKESAQLSTLL